MSATLMRALRPLDPQRIESRATGIGIPDINFIGGWIESKNLDSWPKDADTKVVKFQHPLTTEQGIWLYRRSRAGGLAMVCAKVSNSWFFYDGLKAKNIWHKMTRPQMIEQADLYFKNGLRSEELIRYILKRSTTSQILSVF